MRLALRLLVIILTGWQIGYGCTVPVFRYALDNWPGKTDSAIENSETIEHIADQLISGSSAVWIQIDSGDKAKDDAAFERLTERLKFFESVAELPEIDPNAPSSQLGPGPELALSFSTLRIPRSHPAVESIAGEKLSSLPKDEAWIAPIFGRGRVLGIWQAGLMDEEGIDEACFYLTGACSCQVKVQNPGWDLVMNIDWQPRLIAMANQTAELPAEPIEPETPAAKETGFQPILRPATADINFTPILAAILLAGGLFLLLKKKRA